MSRYSTFTLEEASTSDGNPFGLTLDFLVCRYNGSPSRTDRPVRLDIKEIKVASSVFQPRKAWYDLLARDQHIRNIIDFLRHNTDKDTDPLTVTIVGDEFFLIDGHHRLTAYFKSSRTTAPVVYFEGDPIAAKKETLRLNSTGKLALLPRERSEAAFDLVKVGASEKEVVGLGLVQRATYYTMKAKLSDYPETKDYSWDRARRYTGKDGSSSIPPEDYENPKGLEIAGYLRTVLPASASMLPILSTALDALSPNLPSEELWPKVGDGMNR